MKAIIEANLKAKAIEKMKPAKNPEIVLLICSCWLVLGRGWLVSWMVTFFPSFCRMVSVVKLLKNSELEGARVITRLLNWYIVAGPTVVVFS